MDFCLEAVATAKDYLRNVSEHSEFGGHAMVPYQPQVVRQAFRLGVYPANFATMGEEPPLEFGSNRTPKSYRMCLPSLRCLRALPLAFALAAGAQLGAPLVRYLRVRAYN